MKRIITTLLIGLALVSNCAAFADEIPKIPGLTGITFMTDVTDLNNKRGEPVTIPKSWKLVGTSGLNLWFQDTDGTLYIILGTFQGGGFYTTGIIQRIKVK